MQTSSVSDPCFETIEGADLATAHGGWVGAALVGAGAAALTGYYFLRHTEGHDRGNADREFDRDARRAEHERRLAAPPNNLPKSGSGHAPQGAPGGR